MKLRWRRRLIGFGICCSVFLGIAFSLDSLRLGVWDLAVSQWMAGIRTPWLTLLMQGFTALCSPLMLLVICLVLMFLYRHKNYSIPIAINLMVSVSLNDALKNLFLRDRPPLALRAIAETGYSFPSGHAMAAAAFYGFLMYLVWQSAWPVRRKRRTALLLGLLIVLVAGSRVYLGVHYLSDVVAGLAVATGYLIAYATVVGLYLRSGPSELNRDAPVQNKHIQDSFRHAWEGVAGGLKGERNMIVHFAAMALVTVFGLLLHLTQGEWLACIILFGVVIGMELMNTAIETVVDICMPVPDPRAKLAKDTAAVAVLLVSIAAAVAGGIIFLPKMLPMLR
ncbi:MAG: diacylglycerol kinase [Candidatus Limiplasma sp.]|nr:diacylglycerol kinase [Candidatus Limiplasma sp.]